MTPRKDLTGKRFGKLTVLERAEDVTAGSKTHTAWLCRCDCGNQITVTTSSLNNLDVVQCTQCTTRVRENDLVGRRFGKLLVLRPYSQPLHNSKTWVCRCKCGIEVAYSTAQLKHGAVEDCGVCSGRY